VLTCANAKLYFLGDIHIFKIRNSRLILVCNLYIFYLYFNTFNIILIVQFMSLHINYLKNFRNFFASHQVTVI